MGRKNFRGDIAGTANPNRPKGYTMPYDVMLGRKTEKKKRDGRTFLLMTFALLSQCHHLVRVHSIPLSKMFI